MSMKCFKSFTGIFLLSLLTFSCSRVQGVLKEESLSIDKIATLKQTDGLKQKVHNIQINQDTIMVSDAYTNTPIIYHRNDVERIMVKNRLKGLLQGTAMTMALGAAIGFIGPFEIFDPVTHAAIGTGIGLVAAPIPSVIIGSRDTYIFETTEKDSTWEQISLSNFSSSFTPEQSLPTRGGFSALRNQLLIGGYFTPILANVDAVFLGKYVRYIEPTESLFGQIPSESTKIYVSATYYQLSGDRTRSEDLNWFGGFASLSYGSEQERWTYRRFGIHSYWEIGLAMGEIYADGDPESGGLGLCGAIGLRAFSATWVAESQIGIDMITKQFVPNFSLGFRF